MNSRDQRRAKTKHTIRGTSEKPRLVVFRSNRYVYGQLIDDSVGKTLASVDKVSDASALGKELANKAKKIGVSKIVFDRAGYKYHGKVKKIADSAREEGLQF